MKQEPDLRGGWLLEYKHSADPLEQGWYIRPNNGSPLIGPFTKPGWAHNAAVSIACDNRRADDLDPAAGGSQRELHPFAAGGGAPACGERKLLQSAEEA